MNFIFIILIVCLLIIILKEGLVKTKANDNNYYYTQRHKSQEAANILSLANKFKENLINKLLEEPLDKYVKKKLKNKIIIKEIPKKYNTHIAYTLNKTSLYLCLRKDENTFETNMNALYFIIMHELGHVISITRGHTQEFWDKFKFILKIAIKNNLYDYKNYFNKPVNFCKKEINSTPYLK